ncbi:MAG TPA: hypothetical protein VM638_06110 [Actinomycetota bacterium]|nr:hypothetical protein [Actinomycetota bacterium]
MTTIRARSVALALAAGVVLTALPASAYPRPGRVTRISLAADGSQSTGESYHAVVSADGGSLTFTSYGELLPEDRSGHADVYVKDLRTNELELVSVTPGGIAGENHSRWPSISADGRIVAFESEADDLVPGDTNAVTDVFVYDRGTGVVKRVSVTSDGAQVAAWSRRPEVSADGRHVVFYSESEELDPNDVSPYIDVFVHDLQTGKTELVSVSTHGTQSILPASGADISGDGNIVAFSARYPLADPPDVNGIYEDVFIRDRAAGTTERISDSALGLQGESHSIYPSLSDDGRYVAFQSLASTLISNDSNRFADIYVYDRVTERLERVSVGTHGQEGNHVAASGSISADGRYVVFVSGASNLSVEPDQNGVADVFVHDRLSGTTELLSRTPGGTTGDHISHQPSISGDGRIAAFISYASDLVPDDTNGVLDIFTHDRGPELGTGEVVARRGSERIDVEGWARFAGRIVAQGTDFTGDAVPAGYADLAAASLVQRPEEGDLQFRVQLGALPETSPAGVGPKGLATISYSASFTVASVTYRVTVVPMPETDPLTPSFTLSRCVGPCTPIGPVPGSFGGTMDGFVVSVPLATIGLTPPAAVSSSSVASHQTLPGSARTADTISLGGGTIGAATVSAGIAPPGTPVEDVVFAPAPTGEGRFWTSFPAASGARDVWVRACLAGTCRTTKAEA